MKALLYLSSCLVFLIVLEGISCRRPSITNAAIRTEVEPASDKFSKALRDPNSTFRNKIKQSGRGTLLGLYDDLGTFISKPTTESALLIRNNLKADPIKPRVPRTDLVVLKEFPRDEKVVQSAAIQIRDVVQNELQNLFNDLDLDEALRTRGQFCDKVKLAERGSLLEAYDQLGHFIENPEENLASSIKVLLMKDPVLQTSIPMADLLLLGRCPSDAYDNMKAVGQRIKDKSVKKELRGLYDKFVAGQL